MSEQVDTSIDPKAKAPSAIMEVATVDELIAAWPVITRKGATVSGPPEVLATMRKLVKEDFFRTHHHDKLPNTQFIGIDAEGHSWNKMYKLKSSRQSKAKVEIESRLQSHFGEVVDLDKWKNYKITIYAKRSRKR